MITNSRKKHIIRTIDSIFRQIDVQFPLDIDSIIKRIPNCRMMSYHDFAETANCFESELPRIFHSQSGCTHLDVDTERYLILFNEKQKPQRVLWTKAHEFGHIALGHFKNYTGLSQEECDLKEQEADFFAANLLAPFWALKQYDVQYAGDIQVNFGLSQSASGNRLMEYKRLTQAI